MYRGILTSLMIIGLAFTAIIGGTLAWFTDSAVIGTNFFTTGTVKIEAGESWDEGYSIENWNPGDSTEKRITLEVTGSKRVFVRAWITEMWEDAEEVDGDASIACESRSRDIANVKWRIESGDWPGEPAQWQSLTMDGETYWYYKGMLYPGDKITVLSEVSLDLDETDNRYQGATYTLTMGFEAIQVTHEAVESEWGAAWNGFDWSPSDS